MIPCSDLTISTSHSPAFRQGNERRELDPQFMRLDYDFTYVIDINDIES